jgi:hypothetical protein
MPAGRPTGGYGDEATYQLGEVGFDRVGANRSMRARYAATVQDEARC